MVKRKDHLGVKSVFHKSVLLPGLALGVSLIAGAQAPAGQTKVGIIHIQQAIISTRDGQKAVGELQARFDPRSKEIEKQQNEIVSLRNQLNSGSNLMSEEAKQQLMRQIDQKTKAVQRDNEDARADLEQDQQRVLQELGQKMMVVVDKYARDNGYALILDISSPQTPVLYAANGIDVTQDIVALYDKNTGGGAAAAPAPTTAPPAATPAPAPAKPAAAPAKK
jgi:outer membrane protein